MLYKIILNNFSLQLNENRPKNKVGFKVKKDVYRMFPCVI